MSKYNTKNTYLIGLDPTCMQLFGEELYKWVRITHGDMEQPAGVIANQFGTRYIMSDLRHTHFLGQVVKDSRLVENYRDEDAVVEK